MRYETRTSVTHPIVVATVHEGPGALGLTFCPGKKDTSHYLSGVSWNRDIGEDLAVIRQGGWTRLITLLEEHEFRMLSVESLNRRAEQAGLEWHHFPIQDLGVPEDREVFGRFRSDETGRIRAGSRTVVHCRGGLGRAGLVAATLLVDLGVPAGEAILRVRSCRSPQAIETFGQEQFVRELTPVLLDLQQTD